MLHKKQFLMQRPPAVTIFGILNIVFAAFGAFGILASLVMLSMPMASNNPALRMMRENPAYMAWMKLSIPLGLLASAALLVSGIGLLCLKGWARLLAIGYAIYALISRTAGMILNFFFVIRPMLQTAHHQQGPEAIGAIAGVFGGAIGGCFSLVYPILLLIFMTRPKVVAAFRPPPAVPV